MHKWGSSHYESYTDGQTGAEITDFIELMQQATDNASWLRTFDLITTTKACLLNVYLVFIQNLLAVIKTIGKTYLKYNRSILIAICKF